MKEEKQQTHQQRARNIENKKWLEEGMKEMVKDEPHRLSEILTLALGDANTRLT